MSFGKLLNSILALAALVLGALAAAGTASNAESGITIDGVVPLPDYSASSQDRFYSNGPTKSGATINGRSIEEMGGEVFSSSSNTHPDVERDLNALPDPVWRMVMELARASQSDTLLALRTPIEMNEMPPSFGVQASNHPDPIEQLRSLSSSGEDSEILTALGNILNTGFVHIGIDTPYEAYVWPYFATAQIATLHGQNREELRQLLPANAYQQSVESGRYAYFVLGISPDGVWQYFFKEQ